MIMLDRWEVMGTEARYDKSTLADCQALADEMCASIFERLGLDVQSVEGTLRVSGRGLTFIFPIRDRTSRVRPPVPDSEDPVPAARPSVRGRRSIKKGRG
jgi:hypothetical protein